MKIPNEVLHKLIMWCEANDIGLCEMGDNKDSNSVKLILMGPRSLSPDQAAIIAVGILISGVINGEFYKINEAAIIEQSKTKIQ